jgi:hypothetical protein
MSNSKNLRIMEENKKYITIEENIPYDNDDYGLWKTVYYDLNNKKIEVVTIGHGLKDEIGKYSIGDWQEALKKGIVTSEDLAKVTMEYLRIPTGTIHTNLGDQYDLQEMREFTGIPCVVRRGRKVRGENITYQRCYKKQYRWNPQYDRKLAIVLDEDGTQYEINPAYVEFDINKWNSILKNVTKDSKKLGNLLHCIAYDLSYYSCDRDHKNWTLTKLIFC